MKPSETVTGKKWINLFPEPDRSVAGLLIDSLEIQSTDEMLTSLIAKLQSTPAEFLPTLVIPIRSLEDLPKLAEPNQDHIAYKTFTPGEPHQTLPGSEAEVSTQLRNLFQGDQSNFLPPTAEISELREKKIRSITFITDYVGSGTQAKRFTDTFKQNHTIASWLSYKKIKFRILSFASSIEAQYRLDADKYTEFETIRFAKSRKSANWDHNETRMIINFCEKYPDHNKEFETLGYDSSFGLYLTSRRVPNNLPAVLLREDADIPGLFANRVYPHKLFLELPKYVSEISLLELLRKTRGLEIAEALESKTRPRKGIIITAVLHLLSVGRKMEDILPLITADTKQAGQIRTTLLSLDLVDLNGRLTDRGIRELEISKKRIFFKTKPAVHWKDDVIYVPSKLR